MECPKCEYDELEYAVSGSYAKKYVIDDSEYITEKMTKSIEDENDSFCYCPSCHTEFTCYGTFGDYLSKSETQWKLAERVSKAIKEVRGYAEKNK